MLEGLDGSLSFDFHQLLNASAYGNWLDIVVKDMVHETPKFIGLIKDQLTRVVSKNDDSDLFDYLSFESRSILFEFDNAGRRLLIY